MSISRFVYKTHKWLAVGAGLMTFFWFVSGLALLIPTDFLAQLAGQKPNLERAAAGKASRITPDYRDIQISIPDAIRGMEKETGSTLDVQRVVFRRLLGQLYYEIETQPAGTILVNSQNGERLRITPDIALNIVRQVRGVTTNGPVEVQRQFDRDYNFGPLPVYRIAIQDSRQTMAFVSPATGEVRTTNKWIRWRGYVVHLHTLDDLRPYLGEGAVRLILFVLSVAGVFMSLLGAWILGLQFVQWRGRRTGVPA